ncbi:MAG: Inner membrane protein YqjA [Parcubacteria group bacterium ADurb.Bin316]|nr:MAG: Inner membrane protein YqjA [Parcubacteria group bacterium ADurb.Bin316]
MIYNIAMSTIIQMLLAISAKMGYGGIFILMTIESSFVPFPSEVVIPPAAYLAQKGEMNIFLVIFFGILGSLVGATINYFLAMTLGRRIVYGLAATKYAKFFLINEQKIKKAEDCFISFGKSSTFIGRLVPGIRQLISIPAGFAKMKFFNFILFTFLGSGIWVIILAGLGYWFGANDELIKKYYQEISYVGLLLATFFVFYLVYKIKKTKNNDAPR